MIRAGKLRPIGSLYINSGGSNWGEPWVLAANPAVRAEKLRESASQRKTAAGLHGVDSITYRMRYRADVVNGVEIRTGAAVLKVVGVENVDDKSRELLVTVNEQRN